MSSDRATLRLPYPDQRQRTSNRRPALRMLPWRSRPCVGAKARNRRARWRIGSSGSSATTSERGGVSATSGAMARFVTDTSFASGGPRGGARTRGGGKQELPVGAEPATEEKQHPAKKVLGFP